MPRSCKSVTTPEIMENDDIYLAMQSRGKIISDSRFRTSSGSVGGFNICSHRTKSHSYMLYHDKHPNQYANCKEYFSVTNKTLWKGGHREMAIHHGGTVMPFIRLVDAAKSRSFTFNANIDSYVRAADAKPAPKPAPDKKPAQPAPDKKPAPKKKVKDFKNFSSVKCSPGKEGRFNLSMNETVLDGLSIPVDYLFSRACRKLTTREERKAIDRLQVSGAFEDVELKLLANGRNVFNQYF